ncbi:MAG: MFS transporter [Betaproteobacteria bacterium]|nr:MFS transporter [Betaproteobacteria bacterium]
MKTNETASTLAILSIVLLGLNLRPALAAIGPVLDAIQAQTGLGNAGASLLTALPMFVMGIVVLGGGGLQRSMGGRRGIPLGALLIALGCAGRWLVPEWKALILTAVLAGTGIAFVQALLPEYVKRRFSGRSSVIMGYYSTAIMAGGVIAAISSAWIAIPFGWPGALGLWALPALAAFAMWNWVQKTSGPECPVKPPSLREVARSAGGRGGECPDPNQNPSEAAETPPRGIPGEIAFWRRQRAWTLMLFFGLGTCAYTLVLAWLPSYFIERGREAIESGHLLGGFTGMGVIGGLTVSACVARFPDRRLPSILALLLQLLGLFFLIAAPGPLAWPACLLLGLGGGAFFPLSLIVALDHFDDPAQAGALLAFVQGGGYLVASLMPLIAGLLRESFSSLLHAWTLMALITLLMMAMAFSLSPASYRRAFHRGA